MNPLLARLTETITVKRTTTHTDAGDPTRGTSFTARARVERSRVEQGDADARGVDSAHRLFTDTEIRLGDLVFFAENDTGNDDTGHRVIAVDPKRRLGGELLWYEVRF